MIDKERRVLQQITPIACNTKQIVQYFTTCRCPRRDAPVTQKRLNFVEMAVRQCATITLQN
jgi:hypothetical protein